MTVRMALVGLAASLLLQDPAASGCGFTETGRGPGEPCTRSAECQSWLECRGGVCMETDAGDFDASWIFRDGGRDSGQLDSGETPEGGATDSGVDSGSEDAASVDGGGQDASTDADGPGGAGSS